MTILVIENENIATIKDDAFSKLVHLQYLGVDRLQISTFEPFAFRGLNDLLGTFVLNNALTTLPVELLEYIPKVLYVHFEDNGIVEIPKGFLNNNPHVTIFIFRENVDRFCKSLFNGTTELSRVDLSKNPCVGSKSSFTTYQYDSYQMFIDEIFANTENCMDTCLI